MPSLFFSPRYRRQWNLCNLFVFCVYGIMSSFLVLFIHFHPFNLFIFFLILSSSVSSFFFIFNFVFIIFYSSSYLFSYYFLCLSSIYIFNLPFSFRFIILHPFSSFWSFVFIPFCIYFQLCNSFLSYFIPNFLPKISCQFPPLSLFYFLFPCLQYSLLFIIVFVLLSLPFFTRRFPFLSSSRLPR